MFAFFLTFTLIVAVFVAFRVLQASHRGGTAAPRPPAVGPPRRDRFAQGNKLLRGGALPPGEPLVRRLVHAKEKGWIPASPRTKRKTHTDLRPPSQRFAGLPDIDSPDVLWRWLGLSSYAELVHLADPNALQHRASAPGRIANYRTREIPKRSGGTRTLHIPKPKLMAVQRRILAEILERVPVHPAAMAYRKRAGGIEENARSHTGAAVVFRSDLQDFFPSIELRRVVAIFRWLGYSQRVAHIFGMLCTVPNASFGRPRKRRHLPQGAPTSPALSNIVCWRMDRRLSALAKKFHARYTRYADDLAFSGGRRFDEDLSAFIPLFHRIVKESRFLRRREKEHFARRHEAQRVTGLIVNTKPSVGRAEIDTLRAILNNARKAGSLESQNRTKHPRFAEHLRGRIAWVERFHPGKGRKLREQWTALAGTKNTPPPPPPSRESIAPPPE